MTEREWGLGNQTVFYSFSSCQSANGFHKNIISKLLKLSLKHKSAELQNPRETLPIIPSDCKKIQNTLPGYLTVWRQGCWSSV